MFDEAAMWEELERIAAQPPQETPMIQAEPEKLKLRPYQEQMVNGCRSAFASGQKRVVAYLCTGAGKTATAIAMIQMALEKKRRVAFICNRLQLIGQTCDAFTRYGISHGIIQGSNTVRPFEDVVVCSIQTVAKRGLPAVDMVIVDECHSVPGTKTYTEILKGKYVVGLTATPYQKGMGRNIPELGGKLFEAIVVGAAMRDLMKDGYLVDADVWAPADPDLKGVKVVAGDYQEGQLAEAMNKPQLIGDIVGHWLELANGTQTMVFAVDIAHSKHICEEFRRNGINAVHVDYHMTDDEKKEIYRAFRAGEFTILCNCALLSEGADFPACETLILARPTKSKVRYVQMFGRVLRPSQGKTRAKILDHSGTVGKLGFPWDFSVTHLDDGTPKKTTGSEKKEKSEPLPCKCPKCSFMKPPKTPICPGCGYESRRPSEVETAEGKLVQLRGKKSKTQTIEDLGRTEVYHQLLGIAVQRGYKEGWAAMKYKEAFGTWPNGISKVPKEPCSAVLSYVRHLQIRFARRAS